MSSKLFEITAEGGRLDAYISAAEPSVSRSAAARLCEEGSITVNGKAVKKNYILRQGDRVELIPTKEGIKIVHIKRENVKV